MVRALDDDGNLSASELRLTVPPNSIEAEQSVLGGIMLDNEAWDKIADLIVDSDFYRKDHRIIFAGIAAHCGQHFRQADIGAAGGKRNQQRRAGHGSKYA